jgi:hypothetical protein
MKYEYSDYATNYMTAIHNRREGRAPAWSDVAAAYDAGLTHAIAVTPVKRQALIRYLKALRVINATRGDIE